MSQNENSKANQTQKPRLRKRKNNIADKNLQCHIHNVVWESKDEIRKDVCIHKSEFQLREFEGEYYCLFHYPSKDKDKVKFNEFFQSRLDQIDKKCAEIEAEFPDNDEKQNKIKRERHIVYDFRYLWFPYKLNLRNYKFSAFVNFSSTVFTDEVDIHRVRFSSFVIFGRAVFESEAKFNSSTFSSYVSFRSAMFKAKTDFRYAVFEEKSKVSFRETRFFNEINFKHVIIDGYVIFNGNEDNQLFVKKESLLNLQKAQIADTKKITFHTVRLEPSWFVNFDPTEFVFTNCKWQYPNGKRLNVKTELQNLKERKIENPNVILTKTCWQLADNFDESKSFLEASVFRLMANESKRLEEYKGWKISSLHWWYWLSSFYGESWQRALFVLVVIIFLIFPIIYTQTEFQTCSKDRPIATSLTICESKDEEIRKNCTCRTDQITFTDAIVQSLTTATLQNVEYRKPLTVWGEIWIILEKIFAPLQAALLALAIRRKFMR